MQAVRAPRLAGLPLGLILAGLLVFGSRVGVLPTHAERDGLLALAGLGLIILALRVDPAWLLTGGLVSTLFAGHWDLLGLSSTVGPDRILLAIGTLAVLLRLRPARLRPSIPFTPVHVLLGEALLYALISAVIAGTLGRHAALFELIDQFGALPFLLFLLAPVVFRTERQRQILLASLVAAGFYLSVTAVFEKTGLHALVIPSYISDPTVGIHFGRARGPFVDAGADGLAMFGCAVAAAVAYVQWRDRWARAAAAAVVFLGLVGVLLTETRGVWLAAAVATAVTLATTPRLRRFLLPGAAACVVLVIGAFAFIPGLAQQTQTRLNDSSSVYERQNTTAAGLRMVAARPLLGFGWQRGNDNLDSYFRVNPRIPLTGEGAGFHNQYLEYAVSLGLVGAGLWALAVGSAFFAALTGPVPPDVEQWRPALKAILVAWAIVGLTAPADFIFSTALLWIWAGVIYGAKLLSPQDAPASEPLNEPV